MKKTWMILITSVLMLGCSKEIKTFEFVGKSYLGSPHGKQDRFSEYHEYYFENEFSVTRTIKTYNHEIGEWGPHTTSRSYKYEYFSMPDMIKIYLYDDDRFDYAQFIDKNTMIMNKREYKTDLEM